MSMCTYWQDGEHCFMPGQKFVDGAWVTGPNVTWQESAPYDPLTKGCRCGATVERDTVGRAASGGARTDSQMEVGHEQEAVVANSAAAVILKWRSAVVADSAAAVKLTGTPAEDAAAAGRPTPAPLPVQGEPLWSPRTIGRFTICEDENGIEAGLKFTVRSEAGNVIKSFFIDYDEAPGLARLFVRPTPETDRAAGGGVPQPMPGACKLCDYGVPWCRTPCDGCPNPEAWLAKRREAYGPPPIPSPDEGHGARVEALQGSALDADERAYIDELKRWTNPHSGMARVLGIVDRLARRVAALEAERDAADERASVAEVREREFRTISLDMEARWRAAIKMGEAERTDLIAREDTAASEAARLHRETK